MEYYNASRKEVQCQEGLICITAGLPAEDMEQYGSISKEDSTSNSFGRAEDIYP